MPLSTALPDSGSMQLVVGEHVAVHARVPAGDRQLDAVEVVAPTVRDADHAGADGVGDLDRHVDRPGARRHLGVGAVDQAQPLGVVGMDVEGAAGLALHQHLDVVHPRVVRAQVAAADERHPRGRGVERLPQPGHVLDDRLGRQLDHARRRAQHVGQPGLERPHVDAVGVRQQHVEREPAGVGAEPVAVGPGAQHQVDEALGPGALAQQCEDLVGLAARDRAGLVADRRRDQGAHDQVVDHHGVGVGAHALGHERQAGQDLPLVELALVERQHGRAVVGHVAQGELEQRQVVVALLQRGGGRQDHVGVAGRLVHVGVDGHVELEAGDGRVEPSGVGGRQHRVPRHGHQRPDLSLPGRVDLLGQHRHRQLAQGLTQRPGPGCAGGGA